MAKKRAIREMGVSKIGASQNEWFIMEHPIKMDNLGVPLFSETSEISKFTLVIQCHQFFWGDQTIQMHGNLEGMANKNSG